MSLFAYLNRDNLTGFWENPRATLCYFSERQVSHGRKTPNWIEDLFILLNSYLLDLFSSLYCLYFLCAHVFGLLSALPGFIFHFLRAPDINHKLVQAVWWQHVALLERTVWLLKGRKLTVCSLNRFTLGFFPFASYSLFCSDLVFFCSNGRKKQS